MPCSTSRSSTGRGARAAGARAAVAAVEGITAAEAELGPEVEADEVEEEVEAEEDEAVVEADDEAEEDDSLIEDASELGDDEDMSRRHRGRHRRGAPLAPSAGELAACMPAGRLPYLRSHFGGAVAQLGERLNGIQEVDGSIPFGSTNNLKDLAKIW